jgi:hypothetical protein
VHVALPAALSGQPSTLFALRSLLDLPSGHHATLSSNACPSRVLQPLHHQYKEHFALPAALLGWRTTYFAQRSAQLAGGCSATSVTQLRYRFLK